MSETFEKTKEWKESTVKNMQLCNKRQEIENERLEEDVRFKKRCLLLHKIENARRNVEVLSKALGMVSCDWGAFEADMLKTLAANVMILNETNQIK